MSGFNRRQFIQIGGASAGGAVVASGLVTNWWGHDDNPILDPGTDGDRVVPTFCELCFWRCGVLAHVKNGKVTKLTGNPDHPLSRGRLCPRGVGGAGLLYDPDRLKKPLIRIRKRGADVFEEVSWDKALDYTAEQLLKVKKKYGPEALALFKHGYGGSWFKHLSNAYGSPNIAAPSYAQCRGPREVAFNLTFGSIIGSPEAVDIENARVLVLIGSHLGENMHNTQVQEMADGIGKGMELVVVDPRHSVAASKAKYWLPIKPGTDTALLLAWMNVIISEKRYDVEYVAKHTEGFDELKKHIQGKTPEWAYPITGLKPELIRETARFISAHKPRSLIHPGRHTTWYGDDTQRMRCVAILVALLGSWGRKGGYKIYDKMKLPKFPYTQYGHKPKGKADRPPSAYPLAEETLASGLCDATVPGKAPYPIKAWMVYGTNLITTLPNQKQTKAAIQKLDFMVTIDVLPAEICGWSDVVLPESTYLERCDDLWAPYYKQPFVAVRQEVVKPMYDSKPGWWIAKELGHRLGLKDYFPWKDSLEYAKQRVKAAGLDCNVLQKKGVILGKKSPTCEEEGLPISFDTDSKKIELFSKQLDAAFPGQGLPSYTPQEEVPAGMFRLLFGRSPVHTFGRTTNNRLLSECFNENEVWINVDAAKSLPGFEDKPLRSGEKLVLINQDGVKSSAIRAKVTQRIRGDCVYMVHGYGHTAKGLKFARARGASDSQLVTRYKVDPIMGGTGMNVNFVRLERAGGAS
jgi:thiosulfate reductase / polysulfide reductase chain A